MTDAGARICKRLQSLIALRQPHETTWRECLEKTFPIRAGQFTNETHDAASLQKKQADLLDSTGTEAAVILASALMSGLTPANARWFMMDVANASQEEQRWLDGAADIIWRHIHSSNFDADAFEAMIDMVVAGWFALYIEEDREQGGYRFEQWPIDGVYCAASKPGGLIDIVYRPYTMTAEQAVAEFGDTVSERTRKLAADTPDEKVRFVHAIEPRAGYREGAKQASKLAFASYKVEVETKHIVSESGYHEFPVVVPRWMTIPGSVYAVGKVFDVLPTLKMLNKLMSTELSAADLAIAGMWIAEDDGVLNPRSVKVGPRKIIVANSVDSMKPLTTGADFQVAEWLVTRLQDMVRRQMMADQLTPRDGPALTATEVHANMMLLRQMLGPTFGRLQPEYLQRMIERCFGIAYRAGALGRPPQSLSGRKFAVKYISPLARAQKLEEVTAMDRLETTLMTEAQARPEVLDLYDWDEAVRLRAQMLGVPHKLILDADVVEDERAANEERQQAAQAQQVVGEMATRAAPAVAPALLGQQ